MRRLIVCGLLAASSLACTVKPAHEPRATFSSDDGMGHYRFECWDSPTNCESDAQTTCDSIKRGPRSINRDMIELNGRKLFVMEVRCSSLTK